MAALRVGLVTSTRLPDWAGFDVAVIRSTWDDIDHLADFEAWLDSLAEVTLLLNPAELVRWNLHKRYLVDLADRGVPIVPTVLVERGADLPDLPAGELVVKPRHPQGRHAWRVPGPGAPRRHGRCTCTRCSSTTPRTQPSASRTRCVRRPGGGLGPSDACPR